MAFDLLAYAKERKKETSGSTQQTHEGQGQFDLKDYALRKNAGNLAKGLSDRVNTWLQNHNNYIQNYQTRYSGRKFNYEDAYVSDSSDWLDTVNKQRLNFQAEADNILSYLDQYKGYLDSEYVSQIQKTLTDSLQQQKSISAVASQDNDWWSNFRDEQKYQTAGRYDGYQKKYSGKEYDDIQKAIEALDDGEEKEWLRIYQGDILKGNEDFLEFSKKGASIENPTFDDAQYNGVLFGLKWGNDDVGNIVTFSRDNWEAIANDMADENLHVVGNYLYHYMDENEVDVYNYLLAKEGKERAQEYLNSLEDQLNRRAGTGMAQNIMGIDNDILRVVTQGTFGLTAGLDQWASGTRQFFTDEQLPTSPTQYANAEIYNSLDGFGQNLYTATNVIGNMAPSILVSAVAGGLGVPLKLAQGAGALTMGVSAAGNAYADALDKGYEKGQARTYSTLVGAAEGGLQYLMGGIGKLGGVGTEKIMSKVAMIDNSLLRISAKLGVDLLGEVAEEELQNFLEPALRSIIFGEDYDMPTIDELLETAIVTAITTPILGGKDTIMEDLSESKYYKETYGGSQQELVGEALEIDPNNVYAQKLQGYLDKGKTLNGNQLNRLVQQNDTAITAQDMTTIQSAAESRLTELGETGDVSTIAEALTKQAAGQNLTKAEQTAIQSSKYGTRVANELNPENINSGDYSSQWAQKLDTNRINVEEYSRLVEAAQLPQQAQETAESKVVTDVPKPAQTAQTETVQPETAQEIATAAVQPRNDNAVANDQQVAGKLTGKESLQVTEETPATEEAAAGTVSLEDASQKYGAQAQAMVHTYKQGQDVAKYDSAYQVAYDMGKSGVSFDYVKGSPTVSYLTDTQKELAYAAGKAASDTEAQTLDTSNKAAANGKTGRKKGVVRGEGVTIADLKQTFNDTQGKAYKYLSTVAEVTGIDIVLYRSEAGEDGKFQGAQGRYSRSEPGTIYIDLNAGLSDIKSADDLAKYAMLRTFAHEFTHFIEKWNPIQYNELRKVVFDTLTERGENVHDLIEDKQARNPGMSYDKASREVVAEAMTDILPDANFVQRLSENHKTIFQKLLEQLKEFAQNLRDYFNSIGYNSSKEANALKEQVGETVKYLDSIVQMFDQVAAQAVENYQQTVAEDVAVSEMENTTTVSETESVAAAEETTLAAVAENATTETNAYGFTISDNAEHGSLEITFDSKPSEAVRDVLKENKFRWHKAKKVWYGYGNREDITNALNAAYESETKPEDTVTEVAESVTEPTETVTEPAEPVTKSVDSETYDPNDPYERLKGLMGRRARFEHGNFIYRVLKAGPDNSMWQGHIDAADVSVGGVYISNARGIHYASELYENRDDARDDIIAAARSGHLLDGDTVETTKPNEEVTENGEESKNGSDTPAVSEPVRGSEGPARLLEGVEPETVRGGDEGREPVSAGGDQGTADAGRDRRADAAGDVPERGTRDRVGGDLQQLSAVTEDVTDTNVGDIAAEDKPGSTDPVKLHEIVVDLTAQRSTEKPKGSNFVIGDSLNLPNGTKARTRANIEAIKLVKRIAAEGRIATTAEQEILSKYVGWGGLADAFGKPVSNRETRRIEYEAVKGLEAEFEELKSVLTEEEYKSARESTKNAHYTSIEVIKAMYDGLKQLGFTGGRMLEPSSGVGNFVGAMPADMTAQVKSWTMVELDNITGLFAKYLYPNADVRIQGFEEANIPDGYMDVAIGNVPFGNYAITDKHYPKAVTGAIHNYFFAKSLDKVRTGGIVMFITSAYTMNSRDSAVRKYIMQRADLLGAIRLPNTAFAGNAGTSVVTDILILKKRAERTEYAGEAFESSDWERIGTSGYYDGAYINEYFVQHPEMVLGTPKLTRGMYSSNELTYDPFTDRGSLGDQIRGAMGSIQGKMDYSVQLSAEKENFRQAAAKKKSQKLQVKDGVIQAKDENGNTYKVDVDKDTAARITGMVAIRDAHVALCDALQQGVTKRESNSLRKALNKAYDTFVEKYGYLNSPKNKKAINAFADRYAILSLENYSTEGKKVVATKSDIFTKDTIAANRTASSAENVEEGLTISLNTVGSVDVAMIARLTGQKAESVTRQLIDQRLVFKDKDGNLIPAVQYLSGNVRAKLREMEGLVGIDSDYRNNVEALREVVPPTVQHTDIYVNPGANWVPVEVYEDFVGHILNRRNHVGYRTGKKDFSVEYVPETNEYKVSINDAYANVSAQNTQVWGEGGKAFSTIFENMLNGRRTNVYRDNGDGTRVLDKAKTEAVAEKVEKLNEEFRKWLWEDESRRAEMQELYNETYNALVTPKYSGASLTVNGLNSTYELRPHQKDAVARIINSGGNTLLAHRVGAGKTMEMAAAAMKLKQLGVIKKPMFVVPNNVVAQWGKEFKDYFPAANILVVGDEDMTPAERMTTINKIKNNDYDAVILAATKFEKIQMTASWRQKFYEEQIDSIMFAINAEKESQGGKGFSVKQLEAKRKQLEGKLKKLTDKAKDEDGAMFEDLGVDSLFVDEAHNYKNLEYSTRMNNVSGLGKADGSQRSFDLYTKVRYLQQLNGGRGVVFATATPVMNSMTEMYIMQKYLQPDTLKQLGIEHFDSWAKMFGEVVNALEIAPSGSGYRLKQTFSKFKNVKALQQLFRSFTDVLTDVPGLKIPKMKGGKVQIVQCEQGEFQKNYMEELAQRAENVKNVDPSEDNMLKITSDGRKISYSQRMIDPSLPYEETGKIYKCCENVYAVYQESSKTKGTQMIFCDMATPKGKASSNTSSDTDTDEFAAVDTQSAQLYDDIKERLVQLGIPAKEIAFIHDAKNDKQKAALSEKMNNGTIRVLLGSTGKMGVGLNAQKKAVAIHHLDAPWRPGDIEQRDGRVFRQKNENEEAYKFVYVTKGSFDSRLWDILERKQKFINQVMNGDDVGNEIEDTGEVTLSAAEVKAVASDNPLIMEQVALEKEISKLQSLQQAHRAGVSRAEEKIVTDRRNIANLEALISSIQADIQSRKDTYSSDKVFSIQIGTQTFTDKKDAGLALVEAAQAKAKEGEYTDIGKFAGFTLRVVKTKEGAKGQLSGDGNYEFKTYPLNPTFGINHLISVVEGFEERLAHWSKNLSEAKSDLETQKQLAAEPFAQAEKLKQKRTRYNEVMYILNPPTEQNVADDTVQEQSRAYLGEEDTYDTSGVHWGMEAGIMTNAEARKVWEAIANIGKRGYYYPRTVNGEYIVSADNALFFVKADYRYPAVNKVIRFNTEYNVNAGYAKELIIDARGNPARHGEALRDVADIYGDGFAIEYDRAIYQADARENGRGERADSGAGDSAAAEQHQQRTDTLTDREVLAMATSQVKVDDLTSAEKDALDIFQKRLSKLETLQAERAEQGRLYKEQQFGAKVDRAKAAETLNRMHVLDSQIQKASADVLTVEEKTVLKRVLQKARTVVEQQERQHGQEVLKRWRDRRNNAEAIKKYRDRLRADVDELTNWVLHPDNKDVVKHIPDALKNTVIPFLSSINFMSKRSLGGGNATVADKAFMEQARRLAKVMEGTVDVDEMYSNYTDLPPDFIQNLRRFMDTAQDIVDSNSGDFIINQMTAEELQNLSKVVRTLKKYIMQMNRFHVNAMFKHVYEAGENSIDFLAQLKPAENTGAVSEFLLWQQMRPAYAFERFGEGGMAIYDGLRRGQATLAFNTKKIQAFVEKAYTTAEVKAWENEVKTIRLGPDKYVKMRVSQIMSLYELNKREQAQGHIFGEGIRVATFKAGNKKISDVGQTLTPGELNLILRELTPRQKEVADSLQQFMQQQGGEWGNYVTVARFGEKQFGEENYFPINSDGRHLSVDADEKPGAAALYALLNMGFTKQTQEKAKNRIVVYSIFDVFANHMASMAQYNAFALPVVDALKWFNYQRVHIDEDGTKTLMGSVREQMDRAFGVPEESRPGSGRRGYAQNFVINIIKAFNGTEAQGTSYDSFGLQTLHHYNLAQVAYNFRVVVQQPLAITRAAQLLDYASIIKGMKLSPAAIQRNITEMRKYSGIAAWKSLGFYDVNISRGLTSLIKHDDTVMDKITDVGMWGAEKADTLTWAAIWSACKEEVIRKQKLSPKSEGFYEAVTTLFEEVIYKTQVVDSVLTKNEFMRDKGFWSRAIGSFMSEPTTTASMLIDAYDKYHMDLQRGVTRQQAWKKNGKRIVRTAYVYGIGAVILAAVQAVADAFRDDDDYQEFLEKWLEAFGGNLVDELMPVNKLPIVSDFYELAKELLSKLGVDTYGNPPQSVFMQWYDSLVKGVEILYDRISGESTNYTWYGGAYKLLQAASGISGLPMAAATREIITAWNNTVGAMAPSLKVKTYEPSEKAQIKYAYEDGYLTAEEAKQQLLQQNLVDTEDEAYWTIQGWEAGDGYSRYDAIFDAVRNNGDFNAAMRELTAHGYTEKDVLSNIKGKIGEWYKGGEITKQQATSMLSKYMGMDSEDITETVNKWSSKVVTGIAFEDIKDEYLSGNITAVKAIDMYVRYGGYTKDKATETVNKWRAEKETGVAYDDIKDAFMDGDISQGDAKNMYMTYGGLTEQKAAEKVTVLAFVKKYPALDDITYPAIEKYQTYCEAAGVPAETFYDAWKYESNTDADVDANGESISGSKKVKVLAYINGLDLTYAQKDSLYYAFGWAESKISEAPWH